MTDFTRSQAYRGPHPTASLGQRHNLVPVRDEFRARTIHEAAGYIVLQQPVEVAGYSGQADQFSVAMEIAEQFYAPGLNVAEAFSDWEESERIRQQTAALPNPSFNWRASQVYLKPRKSKPPAEIVTISVPFITPVGDTDTKSPTRTAGRANAAHDIARIVKRTIYPVQITPVGQNRQGISA